ncbi:MAG TPA: chloride channel protein [Flavipsychrobacter sp.]
MKYKLPLSPRKRLKYIFDTVTNDRIRKSILEAIPFWIAALLTGLAAVAYTQLFNIAEDLLRHVWNWQRWSIFIFAPLSFLTAWLIVRLFAKNAGGSGIPQVMAAIDLSATKYENKLSKLLSPRILLTKIASSLFMVFGGGAIGREGPTIQIAGSIFSTINKLIPNSWPKLSQRSFILTGAASGLAAAFNTPLGGIVFAIEELAKIHISLFRTALFTSVIIAGLAAQAILGPYLYLGYPNVKGLSALVFLGVIVVAIVAGMCGAAMCKIILKILEWKRTLTNTQTIIYIIAIGFVIAAAAYFVDSSILGSGKELMNDTLFTDDKYVSGQTLLMRIFGPILSFTVGGAGGIFAPSLSAGASIGSVLAQVFHFADANDNMLILSGMVGFLTGVTRTPFTSAILVLEMTDRHSVIFYLMLSALVSNIAALVIARKSFYEQLKHVYMDDIKKQ